VSPVTPVRELESADPAVIARLDHLLGQFNIRIVKHRNNPGILDDTDGIEFLEFSHISTY
jgi:hypothetical protein